MIGKPSQSRSLIKLRLGLALGIACWWFAHQAMGASFTASLDRDTISLGESATLSLTFNGGGAPEDVPHLPAIANLQLDYVGPSSQISIFNGQVSSIVTHNFNVIPRQAGEYTIPAMSAVVGGQKLSTRPLTLKVLKPSAPAPEAIKSGAELAFLKLAVPKPQVYLGEVVTAELQLYLSGKVQNYGRFQLTGGLPGDGFNLGGLVQGQRRQVRIGNVIYTVVPVSVVLKPVKTGAFSLGPVTATVVVEVASPNRRGDSLFERFGFRDPFDSGERKQLSLATEAQPIQSLALPSEHVPAGFNGAVGTFTLSASAGPTNVAVGDPITMRVQISGRGALDTLTLPEQSTWRDFKFYPPTSNLETNDALGLQGTKTFEQVVVPQKPEIKELPAISFSFFDPEMKSYRTLTQPAVPLVVRPSASAPAPSIVTANRGAPENTPPAQDIVHIKPRLGSLAQAGPPLVQQPWFLALQGVPVLAWLSALMWRRRADSLASNPRLRRQRKVAQIVRDGLAQLRQLAAQNQSDQFFATLVHLLREQLGERLNLPASAITEAVIDEHLRTRGVPDTLLVPLQELFQTCNLARYAPIKSRQELSGIVPKLEALLHELQGLNL